jgi:hypothetical protein
MLPAKIWLLDLMVNNVVTVRCLFDAKLHETQIHNTKNFALIRIKLEFFSSSNVSEFIRTLNVA